MFKVDDTSMKKRKFSNLKNLVSCMISVSDLGRGKASKIIEDVAKKRSIL